MDPLTLFLLVAYAFAALLYLVVHFGAGPRAAQAGRVVLTAGWALQLVDIGVRCFRLQHPASSTSEAMAFAAWVVVSGFLLASLRYRLAAAGAFAIPAALVILLLARIVPVGSGSSSQLAPLGIVHIILATLGVALFAIAAVLAALYLFQERQLKRRHFGLMRARLAPLDTIDKLAAVCVKFGFPVFTVAIVTGAIWVARIGSLRAGTIRPEYALAVASWLAFGALLVARGVAGWQGRRAAFLTLGGFAGAIFVLVAYFLRHAA